MNSIALKIKSDKRQIAVSKVVVPAPQVKKDVEVVKKPSNLFGAVQSKPQPDKEVKNSSNSAGKSAETNVKKEKTSPNRSPNKKNNQPAAKSSAKAQHGKSSASIASFFGKKPTTSAAPAKAQDKTVLDAARKIEKVQIKDEPHESVKAEPTNTSKRCLSNASGKITHAIHLCMQICTRSVSFDRKYCRLCRRHQSDREKLKTSSKEKNQIGTEIGTFTCHANLRFIIR